MENKWNYSKNNYPHKNKKYLIKYDGDIFVADYKCGNWYLNDKQLELKYCDWAEIPEPNSTVELNGLFKHKLSKLEAIITKQIQDFEKENEVCIAQSELITVDSISCNPKSQLVRVKLLFSI